MHTVAAVGQSAAAAPVVVGVDGSVSSLNAVRAAARQASAFGCPLHIVHAFNWLPTMHSLPGCQDRDLADDMIDEAVRLASEVAPDIAITTLMTEGSSTTVLLREARMAALLVIGDGGVGTCTCLPTGSSVVQLAARAPSTVLIARAGQGVGGPIVVGVDRSAVALRVLDFAFTAAARLGTALVVVTAEDSPSDGADDRDRRRLVDDVARRADSHGVPAAVRSLPGDPADVLRAESRGAEMLVVGPRGDYVGRGLLGPVTQTLLHHATVPLVIVRRPMSVPVPGAPAPTIPARIVRARVGQVGEPLTRGPRIRP
jgi:nucleotide-binding universal stress UspA family protein